MSILSVSDTEREQEFSKTVQKEKLISLVETRPVLWDKALDIYKDKVAKATAWREICAILMDNYQELPPKDRHEFGKFVIRKWSQTRDAWIRTLKEEKKCLKSGVPSKPYRYHDQMMFLKRVVLTGEHDNESSLSKTKFTIHELVQNNQYNACSTGSNDKTLKTTATENLKRRRDEEEKMKSFIDCQNAKRTYLQEEDRNLNFFRSLLPSLALLDDDQTLEFQSGVLSLLQSIKRRPANCEWNGHRSQNYFSQPDQDPYRSPSATSLSTHSQSSEVPDPLHVKLEKE